MADFTDALARVGREPASGSVVDKLSSSASHLGTSLGTSALSLPSLTLWHWWHEEHLPVSLQ